MISLRNLIERQIRRLKRDSNYQIDPALSTGDLLELVWRRGLAMLRGLCLRPRLGKSDGWVFVDRGVRIAHPRHLFTGRSVTLENGVQIDALSRGGVHLGDNVSIGRYSVVEATGVLTKLGEGLSIGSDSNLGDFSFVGAAGGVRIGRSVLIGQRVSFHSENHITDRIDVPMKEQGVTNRGISVEDDCWLGSGVIILDGVTIGRGSVVAAGSVVTRDVPAYSLVGGVPARIIRSRMVEGSGHHD